MNARPYFIYFTLVVALLLPTGCITTNVKGFTDLDYQNYRINRIMIRAPNTSFAFGELLERSMIKELEKKGVEAKSFMATFPPTRKWTNEQVTNQLLAKEFDSIIHINLMSSNSNAQSVGYINSGNAYAYGNTASYSGMSVAITAFRRYTTTRVTVYDAKSAKVIWIGDTNTNAGGKLFLGDKATADSIAQKVVKSLAASGHL
jgi:hypothetical protein